MEAESRSTSTTRGALENSNERINVKKRTSIGLDRSESTPKCQIVEVADNRNTHTDRLSTLPVEIMLHILSFIGISDHPSVAGVSKTFLEYSQDKVTFKGILHLKATFKKICASWYSKTNIPSFAIKTLPALKTPPALNADKENVSWDELTFCSESMRALREAVRSMFGRLAYVEVVNEEAPSPSTSRKAEAKVKADPIKVVVLPWFPEPEKKITEVDKKTFIYSVVTEITNNSSFRVDTKISKTLWRTWPQCALLRCLTDYLDSEDEVFKTTNQMLSDLKFNEEKEQGFLLISGGRRLTSLFMKLKEKEWPQSSRLRFIISELLYRDGKDNNNNKHNNKHNTNNNTHNNTKDVAILVHEEADKHLNADRFEESAYFFGSILEIRQNPSADLLIETSRSYWGLQDWATVADLYSLGIKVRPSLRSACWADCGYAHLKAWRYEEARMYYETALAGKDAKQLPARHFCDYGFVLFKLGHWQKAADIISEATSKEPGLFAECYVNHALALQRLGDFSIAAKNLKVAVDKGVLAEVRAIPFLKDFVDIFEKGGKDYVEYVDKCKSKIRELELEK